MSQINSSVFEDKDCTSSWDGYWCNVRTFTSFSFHIFCDSITVDGYLYFECSNEDHSDIMFRSNDPMISKYVTNPVPLDSLVAPIDLSIIDNQNSLINFALAAWKWTRIRFEAARGSSGLMTVRMHSKCGIP